MDLIEYITARIKEIEDEPMGNEEYHNGMIEVFQEIKALLQSQAHDAPPSLPIPPTPNYETVDEGIKAQAISEWQLDKSMHPLTCGNDSTDNLGFRWIDEKVVLFCPHCDYIQEDIPDIVIHRYLRSHNLKPPEAETPPLSSDSDEPTCELCNDEGKVKTPDDIIHPCPSCAGSSESQGNEKPLKPT